MQRRSTALCLLVVIVLAVGCARHSRTSITSTVEPGARNTFRKVLVRVPLNDEFLRRKAERTFADKLRTHGIESVAAIDLLPAGKPPDENELTDLLSRNGIDGILVFELKNYSEEQRATVDKRGLMAMYFLSRPPNQMQGTYAPTFNLPATYEKLRNMTVEISLWDARTQNPVWSARTVTQANRKAGEEEIIMSIADETERKLAADGFLK